MSVDVPDDRWSVGNAYDQFMGRWSRPLAEKFIRWLGPDPGLAWLDVGCGTGSLTAAICKFADPRLVVACDPAETFVNHTRSRMPDPRVSVTVAGDGDLPRNADGFDRVVSGLVLNFLSDPRGSVEAMRARTCSGGLVAAYVWDYAGRMDFLRIFWDEVVCLDPGARRHDEGVRFPVCNREKLEAVFRDGGMRNVRSDAVEIETRFVSFSDYWDPFLGKTGPAPSYVMSLTLAKQRELRDRLERRLATREDGVIDLVARAWAVRGVAP